MEIAAIPITILASVVAALGSRHWLQTWQRFILVITVALFVSYATLRLLVEGESASWFEFLLQLTFWPGCIIGLISLFAANWLLKPRSSHVG